MKKKVFSLLSMLILIFLIIPIVTSVDTNIIDEILPLDPDEYNIISSEKNTNSSNQKNNEIKEYMKIKTYLNPESAGLPEISIKKPLNKWIYKNNIPKRPIILFTTIIIGYITIWAEANASDGKGIEKVEFYIDDEWKYTDLYEPYSWVWLETPTGLERKHTIKVIAYDSSGEQNYDEMTVYRYRNGIHPFLVRPILTAGTLIGATSLVAGATYLLSQMANMISKENSEPVSDNPDEDVEPNKAPSAVTRGPYTSNVNDPLQFDASGSIDEDGKIISYFWNFGDGNTGQGKTVKHVYRKEGEYKVSLTVTDNKGSTDNVITKAIVSNSVADNEDVKKSKETLDVKDNDSLHIIGIICGLIIIAIVSIVVRKKYFK